jgi:4-amino-4-deoxy-L-arabinose transferase-like glycosyltransferase
MHVLQGLGPQEESDELVSYPLHTYTHPYFGQLFLAGVLGTFGYPSSLNPSSDVSSIKSIFLVPRLLMGVLAIADTFLLYKITERRYNRTVAVIASILFAVMLITWLLRRIWLEPIQLPFLLSTILFALYSSSCVRNRRITSILLSGALLGVAIFTKIPVIGFIPLVSYLIYANTKSPRLLGLRFLPVITIPLIWPAYAASIGQFDKWLDGVVWQSERENTGLHGSISQLFTIDPFLIILSFCRFVYAIIRRKDLFIVLCFVSFLIFNLLSGYVTYWHLIPLLPAFCICSTVFLHDIPRLFRNNKIKHMLPFLILCGIASFGLGVTTFLITLNVTSFHYDVLSQIVKQVQEQNLTENAMAGDNSNNTITLHIHPIV